MVFVHKGGDMVCILQLSFTASGKEIIRYTKWLVIFDITLWDCPHITSPGH